MTIISVDCDRECYKMKEDESEQYGYGWYWYENSIEGLACEK